ncbi:threonine/serine exporter family protein [Arthrobacter sp. MPF02]|uniref:threonine/serine exporter family protein n=1 Tax=Arthrobacter sp. MPF02 TaxID=3388492 RepID=UPI0039848A42
MANSSSPESVLNATVATAAALLANGAAAADASDAASRVAAAGGLNPVSVSVSYSDVISYWTDAQERTLVAVRAVPRRVFDYGRLAGVMELVERAAAGRIGPGTLMATLHRLQERKGRYPWWAIRLATGAAGGMAAVLFGGGVVAAAAAFVANLVVDWLFGFLGRRGWPSFFIQAVVGVLAVVIAALVQWLAPVSSPAIIVVAVILIALAGMTSTGAVQDAITGWYVNASGRIFEALANTAGLVAGVQLGLLAIHAAGVQLSVTQGVQLGSFPLPVILFAAALVALGFGIACQTPPLAFAPTAVLAALAYAVFSFLTTFEGPVWAAAAAAFVAGLFAVSVSNRFRLPTTAIATCAILPMLPGVQLYQGLLELGGLAPQSEGSLVTAAAMALALAAGISFGEYCGLVTWGALRGVANRAFLPLYKRRENTGT